MNISLWKTNDDDWSVCEGPGPSPIKGRIARLSDGWVIVGDETPVVYMNRDSAAAAVLRTTSNITTAATEYILKRSGETRTARTYPEIVEELGKDGWTIVTKAF